VGPAPPDEALIRRALEVAAAAPRTGDVPIGAVIVDAEGRELAAACNAREALGDPTAHAEILALRLAAGVRPYRLEKATETRNACPYCAVACGVLIYSMADGTSKDAKPKVVHIEGDPDHPVNRGTLCPKGAGLIDFIHSDTRLKYPEYRAPGSNKWERITWDDALDRIAGLLKKDRDANFVAKTDAGLTVNRWLTTGMLAASASSNEVGYLTHKVARTLGLLAFDNQARV